MKEKEEKTKNKISKRKIFGKVMAFVLLSAMVLSSCSTCIYYLEAVATK